MTRKIVMIITWIVVLTYHNKLKADQKFEHISLEHGLSQSVIQCMCIDSKGFIWFGTQDGLNKYDGYGFTIYKHNPNDTTSISSDLIYTIHEDKEGMLWIGTYNGGLNKYDREKDQFTQYQHNPDHPNSLSDNRITSFM